MKVVLIIVAITMGVFLYTLNTASKAYWENIGPKWHCAFNPDYSEFCVEEIDGLNND